MKKYIDADRLKAEIKFAKSVYDNPKRVVYGVADAYRQDGRAAMCDDILKKIDSLQQDETQVDKMLCSQVWWEEQGWIMIPPDATVEGIESLLKQVRKKLQQEQRETDGDDGKFVKILVRKEFAELFQKLGDEIQAGQSSFVGAMNQQEQPEVDLEKFTQKINDWKARYNYPENIPIKAAMAFTARMFYQYPNVAKQWYEQLPKATMD